MIHIRFDALILPKGATRDFRARIGTPAGRDSEELDREERRIRGEGNKRGDGCGRRRGGPRGCFRLRES